ncbi:MAG: carbohydrate ABC transporter permease [Anaerolineaceae bacterium]|nr:carbohydrate ABC transporter permease [Anaerolineaceae bacterium]
MNTLEKRSGNPVYKTIIYIILIILAALSLFPFIVMIINSTRNTPQIQQHAVSLVPSHYLMNNWAVFNGKTFNPIRGFINSVIISSGATILTIYFSTLTAWALVAYHWKLRNAFFSFILAVMMIPGQITAIGFYQFMYKIHMTNNFLALILPAIAAPSCVFFMRQFMVATFPMELLDAARIDGSGEFKTFNEIGLPIMKPAMATQAIFTFVGNWNQLFMPSILLTDNKLYTMPLMVSQLRGDIYKVEYGAVYLGLTLSVLPLFIIYFALSKYIIAGVALGGVKG